MQGVAKNTGGDDISVMTLIVTVEVHLRPESTKQTTTNKGAFEIPCRHLLPSSLCGNSDPRLI